MKNVRCFKFFLTAFMASAVFGEVPDSITQFQNQLSKAVEDAKSGSIDALAFDYLRGKFLFSGVSQTGSPVLPTWYPEYYPTPSEMAPGSGTKPRLKIFSPAVPSTRYLVPQFEQFKDEAPSAQGGGTCVAISPSKLFYPPQGEPSQCKEFVRRYELDSTGLGSLQVSTPPTAFQTAFIGVEDLSLMEPSATNNFLAGRSSPQWSKREIVPRQVTFLKYISWGESNPKKLKAIRVQVSDIIADVPVPAPFPPAPQCQLEFLGTQPLSAGQTVRFNLKANSVTRGGRVALDNGKEALLTDSNLINLPIRSIGTFQKVNQSPLEFTLSDADLTDSRITRYPVPNNPSLQKWVVTGRVYGVDSSTSSAECSAEIQINQSLPPDCIIGLDKPQLLKGETATATLDCSRGGPVSSAQVTVFSGNASRPRSKQLNKTPIPVRITVNGKAKTDLSTVIVKRFSFTHTKTEVTASETIDVTVTGAGGTRTFSAAVGEVCPYNQVDFVKAEIQSDEVFHWWSFDENNYFDNKGKWICRDCVGGTLDVKNVLFTNGSHKYSLTGTATNIENTKQKRQDTLFMWAKPASGFDWIDNNWVGNMRNACIKADGSWGGCWNGGAEAEQCNSDNFCLMTVQYNNPSGSGTFKSGGHFWWIEIGRQDGKDGGKYDPQCKLKVVKTREGGCFSKDTSVLVADGSQRLVSEVREGDYLLNPHYGVGIRVKNVVKGPEPKALYEILIGKNKVQVTEDHPFYTQRGWIQALELRKGDRLLGEGIGKLVSRVTRLPYRGPQEVWNFELDTNDPLAKIILANEIPTGELSTQHELKGSKKNVPSVGMLQ